MWPSILDQKACATRLSYFRSHKRACPSNPQDTSLKLGRSWVQTDDGGTLAPETMSRAELSLHKFATRILKINLMRRQRRCRKPRRNVSKRPRITSAPKHS